MTEQKYRIWSDLDLDYEDWRADLEADYPELTEDERMMLMHEINGGYAGRGHARLGRPRRRPEELRRAGPAYQAQAPGQG